MYLRKLAIVLSLAAVFPAAQWLMAKGGGGQASAPAAAPARGQLGRGGNPQGDLLYAAVPGRVDDIGFRGLGLAWFGAARHFRFVKSNPTWGDPAPQSPRNLKGVGVGASV